MSSISTIITLSANVQLSHSKLSYKSSFKKANGDVIVTNYGTVVDRYLPILKKYTVDWTMSPEEMMAYAYQPKKLSMFLYGTTEMWSSIMNLNNIYNIAQFNKQTIKVFSEDVFPIIEEILIRERGELGDETINEMK